MNNFVLHSLSSFLILIISFWMKNLSKISYSYWMWQTEYSICSVADQNFLKMKIHFTYGQWWPRMTDHSKQILRTALTEWTGGSGLTSLHTLRLATLHMALQRNCSKHNNNFLSRFYNTRRPMAAAYPLCLSQNILQTSEKL